MPQLNLKRPLALFLIFSFFVISHLSFVIIQPSAVFAYPGPDGRCSTTPDFNPFNTEDSGLTCIFGRFADKLNSYDEAIYGTEDMNLQSYVHEVLNTISIWPIEIILGDVRGLGDLMQNLENLSSFIPGFGSANPPPTIAENSPSNFQFGLIGMLSRSSSMLFSSQPASTAQYVAMVRDSSPIPKVHAQGTFTTLSQSGFAELWRASRNLSYAFFVIAFIVAGFAIMFRVKLSPQTVVTLQSMLPRLVITLILITFSFAIAGLVIDLTNVAGYLLGNLMATATDHNLLDYLNNGLGEESSVGAYFGANYFYSMPRTIPVISAIILLSPLLLIIGVVGTIVFFIPGGQLVGPTIGIVPLIIVLVILLILILVKTVQIFITLAKAYIGLVIAVITGPLQILTGVLPGSQGFTGWLKNLLANAAVFPTVFIMFLLSTIFFLESRDGQTWTPAFFGTENFIGYSVAHAILSLGIFFLTPKAADIIRSMIDKKPFPYGAALGEAWGLVRNVAPFAGSTLTPSVYEAMKPGSLRDRALAFRDKFTEQAVQQGGSIAEKQTGVEVVPQEVREARRRGVRR